MMKALLILVGGRASIPNILTIIHLQPQAIIAICSEESHSDFPQLKDAIEKISPSYSVEELPPVDAFNKEEITIRCEEALRKHPSATWIFNITAATTIMSIAAYEVAKRFQHSCWYLNTSQARVVTLSGIQCEESIFYITASQYVTAYYRSLEIGDLEERRDFCEQRWLAFAQKLGEHPEMAIHLKKIMKAIDKTKIKRPRKDEPKQYTLEGDSKDAYDILESAQQVELLNELSKDDKHLHFQLTYLQDNFLNGGWLEAYVWDKAQKLHLFDDCQWNKKIVLGNLKKELDVVMTYKAQLILVECKTGDETYDTETLNKLEAVANLLGGRFVGKILASSLLSPDEKDSNKFKGHQEFLAKAKSQCIVVIMGEDLPKIGEILKKEAIKPTYPRI